MNLPLNSLVVPVYGNAGSITALVGAIEHIADQVDGGLETVFVIDGSPDDSRELLLAALATSKLRARVVDHSRNFGSFAAIRTGMSLAQGDRIAVMAALNLAHEYLKGKDRESKLDSGIGHRVRVLRERVEGALEKGQQLEL